MCAAGSESTFLVPVGLLLECGIIVMSACFDIAFSDISDDESATVQRDTSERFLPPVSEQQLRERVRQRVPRGTAKANSWAFNVWREWASHRNSLVETQQDRHFPVPVDLVAFSNEALDYWLSLFVMEVRRRDRSAYPPNSLFQIVAGLQRFLREERSLSDVVFLVSRRPLASCVNLLIVE